MIKAIIFDFDGVIIESSEVKTKAFRMLFSDYPEKIDEIMSHHIKNMGISRYVKFQYIYSNILKKQLSFKDKQDLGNRFSKIVKEEVLKAPFVSGVIDFLKQNMNRYLFFICSGTPEDELYDIIEKRRIGGFFKESFGSPETKIDIIAEILSKYTVDKHEAIFIGDANSDRIAAKEKGVHFIARVNNGPDPQFEDSRWLIKDFLGIDKIITQIEKDNNLIKK